MNLGATTHVIDDSFEKCSICTMVSSVDPFRLMSRIHHCHSFPLAGVNASLLIAAAFSPNVNITAGHSYRPQIEGCQGAPVGLRRFTNYPPNCKREMIFIIYAPVSWHCGVTQGRYIGKARASVSEKLEVEIHLRKRFFAGSHKRLYCIGPQ